MTSLVCWIGVDHRRPSSVYFASDSRLSWPNDSYRDDCTKVFASDGPDIFAVVGQYSVLGVVEEVVRTLNGNDGVGEDRIGLACHACRTKLDGNRLRGTNLYMATRVNPDIRHPTLSKFIVARLRLDIGSIEAEHFDTNVTSSRVIFIDGSGTCDTKSELTRWQDSISGGTSRSMFSAFCDGIGVSDMYSGGPPQLAGIWNNESGQVFGVSWKGHVFVNGKSNGSCQRCFNHLFEICDPQTGLRVSKAQVHAPYSK